ncbi:MAG: hypothetical protein P8M34_16265 [Saprospiraceae bacterium]|nr:hypothetical protein [Saprospiraceae bacterium]
MKTIYNTLLAIIIFTFLSVSSFGQSEETLFAQGKVRFTGLWGGAYNAYTTYNDEFNYNGGGFFTFEINHNFLFGWTGYGTDLTLTDGRAAQIGGSDFLLGYTPNSHQVIHPIFYLQAGGGKLEVTNEVDDRVFILQPNVGLEMNVLQWFRIGVEAGYRFVNNVNVNTLEYADLSSPVIGLRLKFGFSKDWRRWDD